jgi:DNA-binding response OmpR family regulator
MSTMPSILVVDDESDLLEQITLILEADDYQVFMANNGLEALEILHIEQVHLIIADIAMPDMNGYQFYSRVRENMEWVTIPFIFLSARTMDSDIRFGKEMGVDDYLTKPIRAADLLAAVRGKLRRAQQLADSLSQVKRFQGPAARFLTAGELQIDLDQHKVTWQNREIKLSAREFTLLAYLAQQAGKVVSPTELIQVTHQLETDPIEAGTLLRPLILSVRRKLDLAEGEIGSIENVRGVGYRLVIPT